jgi:Mg-chelatase subunit ChlD
MVSSSALAATRIRVDTAAWPRVAVSVVLPRATSAPPRLYENGRRVLLVYARNIGRAPTIAVVVDHSQSMHGGALRNAVAVARQLMADKLAGERIALFEVGSKAVQLTEFSRSPGAGNAALSRLRVDRRYGTALYDGVVLAARALQHERGRKVMIIVTDGQETTSRAGISGAISAAVDAHTAVFPVAIENATYLPTKLNTLARSTRGAFFGAATRSSPADSRAIAADIRRTWRVEYKSSASAGETIVLRIREHASRPQITRFTSPTGIHISGAGLLIVAVLGAIGLFAIFHVWRAKQPRLLPSHSRPRW